MSQGVNPERPIVVDGVELEDGFGISFDQEEIATTDLFLGYDQFHFNPGSRLRVWITKRDRKGEYHKCLEVTGSTILMWDNDGRAWEYENGILKIIEDRMDLENEYGGDDENV